MKRKIGLKMIMQIWWQKRPAQIVRKKQ